MVIFGTLLQKADFIKLPEKYDMEYGFIVNQAVYASIHPAS